MFYFIDEMEKILKDLLDISLSSFLIVPRARSVTEGRQLKYTLRIKTKTKGRRRVNTFVESQ